MRWSNRMTPSLISRSFPSSVHWYLLSLLSVGSWLNLIWAIPRFLSRANKWLKSAMLTPSYIMCSFSLYSTLFVSKPEHWKCKTDPLLKAGFCSRPSCERKNEQWRKGPYICCAWAWLERPDHSTTALSTSIQSRMDNTHPRKSWRVTTCVADNAQDIWGRYRSLLSEYPRAKIQT